jgi:hypothetical protein
MARSRQGHFGDAVDPHVEQRIATASLDEIETWSECVASAATLAKVFADWTLPHDLHVAKVDGARWAPPVAKP